MINKVKVKKHKNKATATAEDFKTQLENRDNQQALLIDKLRNTVIENERIQPNIDKSPNDIHVDISNSDITIEDLSKSIKSLQNSKSGGPDGFINEILKNNMRELSPILIKIFNNILHGEEIPRNTSWIVPKQVTARIYLLTDASIYHLVLKNC